ASSGRGGAGFGMVVSGVLGAVIALAGGYALQSGGLLPAPGNGADQVQALTARVDSVSTELATLKTQITESESATGADISAQMSSRLDRLETQFNDMAEAGSQTGDAAGLEALQTRLAGLEAEIASLSQSSGDATPDPALAEAITELRAAQSGLQAAIGELRTQTAAVSGKISALEQGQAELTEQLGDPGRQIDLARAIAAAGLKSAIDRGGPFMAELEAFASVVPDDPAVPELRDLAARGVPSRSRLIEEFPDAASAAIAAAQPVDENAGLVDRLMSSAMSVVKVRKVGDVEGDSAEAIAARAEARLLDGNLDAALAEWNALPEASRLAASDYGNALAARTRAEMLIAASMAPIEPAAPSQAPAN
ncbi:MAG: mitofilin family membrane protein, partial [Hoeflea sp.]|nr:mitofilin family membrane protein [Hoeflea sp.]